MQPEAETEARVLHRELFEPGASRQPADDGLALLRAGSEQGEYELVAEEVGGMDGGR